VTESALVRVQFKINRSLSTLVEEAKTTPVDSVIKSWFLESAMNNGFVVVSDAVLNAEQHIITSWVSTARSG